MVDRFQMAFFKDSILILLIEIACFCGQSSRATRHGTSIDYLPAAGSNRDYTETIVSISGVLSKSRFKAGPNSELPLGVRLNTGTNNGLLPEAGATAGSLSEGNINKSQWMTRIAPLLNNSHLGEVLLPGTHNSGSYSITPSNAKLVNTFLPARLAFAFAKVSVKVSFHMSVSSSLEARGGSGLWIT